MPVGLVQIAILGSNPDAVVQGIKEVGADEVHVVGRPDVRPTYDELRPRISAFDVPSEFHEVEGEVLLGTIRTVRALVERAIERRSDVVLNIGGADRTLTCAGLSSGFVSGVRTFDVIDGEIVHLPVLRFSYDEIVTGPRVAILQGLQQLGGRSDDPHAIALASGIEGSQVTYHIRGGKEGPGLEDLGLVRIVRPADGGIRIELTEMGRTLASGMSRHAPEA